MGVVEDLVASHSGGADYEKIGTDAGLPPGLFPKVVAVESAGNPLAVSNLPHDPAVGPAQVRGATARQAGGNPWNPKTGAKVLAQYIKAAGSVEGGLAMYNTGSKDTNSPAAKRYIAKVGYQNPVADPVAQLVAMHKDKGLSPLASAPPQQPVQQQPNPAAPPEPKPSQTVMDAINRPADRTVELMGQSTQQTLASIKAMVKHPGVKTATNAALNVIGLPFSPITSAVDAFLGDPVVQLAHQLGASPKTDPYVRAAVQMVLPIAGSKSALMQAALGEEGSFLTGGLMPGTPPLKPGQQAGVIAQKLIKHDQQSIAQDVQLRKHVEDFLDTNPDYRKHDEAIYNSIETGGKLSPEAQAAKKAFIDPMRKRNDLYINELKRLGVRLPELVNPDQYIHRQAIEQTPEKNVLGQIGDIVDPTGALTNQAPTKGFGTHPGVLNAPNAGVAESAITGERGGYTIDPTTNEVKVWKDGKVIDKGVEQKGQIITKNGGVWNMSRGSTLEVEQHTPVRYQKSAIASTVQAQRELRDAVANARFMQGLKTSPEFIALGHPEGMATPKDWRSVSIPGYHGFDGWKLDPHLAEVIEDYVGSGAKANVLLQGLNRIMQGSIFINPMGHILNVKLHAAVEAGLFGGTARMIDGTVRAITPGEKTLMRQAAEAVITKNADYLRYVKESPGLKGANNYIRNFGNDLLKQMGKNPQQLGSVAQTLGYANPLQMLRAVYTASNKTLWGVGDYILMKSFLAREAERGGTTAEIAGAVTKHIPDYVIPSRVGPGKVGRGLSEILQSPYALGFSRYEYNRLESYANLMKDLVKPGPGGTRPEAMDQIAALLFHAAVTYPMIDAAIQRETGNKHATFRGFGPFIFTENLNAYGRGEKTAAQAGIQSIARPSSATSLLMDIYQNRDWKDQPIYGHGGKPLEYLAGLTLPTQVIAKIANPPKGMTREKAAKQVLFDQLGIKYPTPRQVANIQKYAQIELTKRAKDKK